MHDSAPSASTLAPQNYQLLVLVWPALIARGPLFLFQCYTPPSCHASTPPFRIIRSVRVVGSNATICTKELCTPGNTRYWYLYKITKGGGLPQESHYCSCFLQIQKFIYSASFPYRAHQNQMKLVQKVARKMLLQNLALNLLHRKLLQRKVNSGIFFRTNS